VLQGLVAIAARDRSRAERFAAEHGVERVLGSYAEVVEDPEVEVVYNPRPNAWTRSGGRRDAPPRRLRPPRAAARPATPQRAEAGVA
jgi:hypothetical protein